MVAFALEWVSVGTDEAAPESRARRCLAGALLSGIGLAALVPFVQTLFSALPASTDASSGFPRASGITSDRPRFPGRPHQECAPLLVRTEAGWAASSSIEATAPR
jgi:hypothetical protein